MREALCYICDVCGDISEDKSYLELHESACKDARAREEARIAERKASGQLTIRELIEKCKMLPNQVILVSNPGGRYDGRMLGYEDSYRGYYDELAITPSDHSNTDVASFLKQLEGSLHRTYSGYRGGEFDMYDDTYVWFAEDGETSRLMIMDLIPNESSTHILMILKESD